MGAKLGNTVAHVVGVMTSKGNGSFVTGVISHGWKKLKIVQTF